MAKTTVQRAPAGAIIVQQPASPARRRASAVARAVGRKAGALAKRGGVAAAKRAWQRKYLVGAAVAGGLAGYVQKNNVDIPHVDALGKNGTMALAAVALTMVQKNDYLDAIASGLVAVAVYDWTSSGTIHGVGHRGGGRGHVHRIIDSMGG